MGRVAAIVTWAMGDAAALHDFQEAALRVLAHKYLQPGESQAAQVFERVAHALAQAEPVGQREARQAEFLHAMQAGLLPSGRILATAGTACQGSLASCFVQPMGDSIFHTEGGHPGIYVALAEATETMRRGGGVGYDFSRIRPRGCAVRGTGGEASGPLSFLQLFECSAATIQAPGARSGAQMAVLRCDHPDILEFIDAKARGGFVHFNLSVGITDAFMRAAENDEPWPLVHASMPAGRSAVASTASAVSSAAPAAATSPHAGGQWVHAELPARTLLARLAASAWSHADPGVLFLDTIARDNPLQGLETLAAANPCGEQPLPAYGGCCLASIDLTRCVQRPFAPDASFDAQALHSLARTAVRLLDDALEVTAWPLPAQREEARAKRRIGLGFTGLGDALVMLGLRYGSAASCRLAAHVAETLRDAAYETSVDLAAERGPFPMFDARRYLGASSFAARLPEALRARILVHGLRHSHLLAIAPTGSISLALADNASPGIEPVQAWQARRRLRTCAAPPEELAVQDRAWRVWQRARGPDAPLPEAFLTASQVEPMAQLAVVAAVAPYVDGGISKTLALPEQADAAQVRACIVQAWRAGLKGVTVFRANPVTGSVFSP
jgi:ribonucleoside-diphosphate reductase alpha chain